MILKTKKDKIKKIYEQIKKLTLQQKKLILSITKIEDITALNVDKLNRYIVKKKELFKKISRMESGIEKKELEVIRDDFKPLLIELHDIENININLIGKNFKELGNQLNSANNSQKLKTAYSNNIINKKPKNAKPKFIDSKNN